jgi:hypothetical protein
MRKNEHPRCSCASCRRGASSVAGKEIHKAVNRKIRRATKQQIKRVDAEDFVSIVVSTPYTD